MHVCSVIETRQSKTTMPDNFFFPKRERRVASGGIQTRDVLRARQTLSTEPLRLGRPESLNVTKFKGKGVSLV